MGGTSGGGGQGFFRRRRRQTYPSKAAASTNNAPTAAMSPIIEGDSLFDVDDEEDGDGVPVSTALVDRDVDVLRQVVEDAQEPVVGSSVDVEVQSVLVLEDDEVHHRHWSGSPATMVYAMANSC